MILIGIFLFFSAPIRGESFYQKTEISQEQLEEVLKKCAEYCEKLSNSVLDFICAEKITEEIFTPRSKRPTVVSTSSDGATVSAPPRGGSELNIFLYDYQMIRKDNKITNRRILLKENGSKRNEVDAELKTKRFKHHNIIFGPIALLDALWQPQYDYKIIQRKKFKGDAVMVIEATPKDPMKTENPFGKLWVKEDDFSIVKIEWDQGSLPFLDLLEVDAENFNSKPEIKVEAEYSFEKNGIRFPSKYNIVETYYQGARKYFIRSTLDVTYKDYKFFTVTSDVKYISLHF